MTYSLSDLGWSTHFAMQVDADELDQLTPARVTQVHRTQIDALTEAGPVSLTTKADAPTGDYAVGDWVLVGPGDIIERRLERVTSLQRRAAGVDAKAQLIAANVDVLFIAASCNNDFNIARLERYLVLARSAGIQPVIVLTKADLSEDTYEFEQAAQAMDPLLPVLSLDSRDDEQVKVLFDWWRPGQTAALVGSSGVGKTTLLNTLGEDVQRTADVRAGDSKGRHTTTSRGLYPIVGNRWLVDTPGMRELSLYDVAEGVEAVFADVIDLAAQCRFSDCQHGEEPGCKVKDAIESGDLDADRFKRWQKLAREEQYNVETIAQSRKRTRDRARHIRSTLAKKAALKGREQE